MGLLICLIPVLLQDTIATRMNEKFLTYFSSELGFKISHPSGWDVIVENPNRVIFHSFGNATMRVILNNASSNMTAHDYALKEINELRGFASDVHVTGVTVGTRHLPGWSVDYIIPPSHHVIDTILAANGKRFTISYLVMAVKPHDVLKIMQIMLNSFQIIK
jgi:hypothetical protein